MSQAWVNRVFLGTSESMAEIPDGVVDVCVTSPPYFNQRDYEVDGQIGMEARIDEYIERMLTVFREVRRVLRPDGSAFLNLGDGYFGDSPIRKAASLNDGSTRKWDNTTPRRSAVRYDGLKPKDLMFVPHRVAIALQRDGWWARDDIVWHKPNAMPSSVTDRCTPAKEYVFHLAKSRAYYADMDAVKEPLKNDNPPGQNSRVFVDRDPAPCHNTDAEKERKQARKQDMLGKQTYTGFNARWDENPTQTANLRNVWTIATESYPGEHFAVMPQELARRCILIGSRPGGLVLDPFMGSGTVAAVAVGCGRQFTGYELNPEYHKLIADRLGLFGAA